MNPTEMKAFRRTLERGLEEYGHICPDAVPTLCAYCEALLRKNQEMNLTAITNPTDVANLHMLDCAALLNCAGLKGKSLIDVGTGAGFPGMVLKILEPSLELTLMDSLNKRLDFLLEFCSQQGIQGVQAIHARAEDAGQDPQFREQFDIATARAVADLRILCEMCLPFVKVSGRFLAMKSVGSNGEIEAACPAIRALGGEIDDCFDYAIPGTDVSHRVVVVEKIGPTLSKYPRRWAKIQKNPL